MHMFVFPLSVGTGPRLLQKDVATAPVVRMVQASHQEFARVSPFGERSVAEVVSGRLAGVRVDCRPDFGLRRGRRRKGQCERKSAALADNAFG